MYTFFEERSADEDFLFDGPSDNCSCFSDELSPWRLSELLVLVCDRGDLARLEDDLLFELERDSELVSFPEDDLLFVDCEGDR